MAVLGAISITGVATPERIDAWLRSATTGEQFVYATRPFLPRGAPGAERMRQLQDAGYVRLHSPRSLRDANLFDYLAIRSSLAHPAAKPPRPVLELTHVDTEAAIVDALLPLLERAARCGLPCPTDRQLADRAGLPVEIMPDAFAAMRAANLIRIHPAAAPTLRRVLIVATGALTGIARK